MTGNPAWAWDERIFEVLKPMAEEKGISGLWPVITIARNPDTQVWVGEKGGRPVYVVFPRCFKDEPIWRSLIEACINEGIREWEKRGG